MVTNPIVQADSHILVNSKLLAYEGMVLEKQKYIKIARIKMRGDFSMDDWILSIINFYDVMFSDVNSEPHAEKYKEVFEWIPILESGKNPGFDILNKLTRAFMSFAQDVGVTRTMKLGTEIHY